MGIDNVVPVITLTGDNPVLVNAGDAYVDAKATASDILDGNITAGIVTVNPVITNIRGNYLVTYDVDDRAGNSAAQVTRTVIVVDNTAPNLTVPADITVEAAGLGGETVNFAATAIDTLFNPDPLVLCQPESGSTFGLGKTTVNCSANDGVSAGAIRWWKAENSSAKDSVDDNDGAPSVGAKFESGLFGQAFSFDGGSGTDVTIPHNANLNLTKLTISAWIKAGSDVSGWRTITAKEDVAPSDTWKRNW